MFCSFLQNVCSPLYISLSHMIVRHHNWYHNYLAHFYVINVPNITISLQVHLLVSVGAAFFNTSCCFNICTTLEKTILEYSGVDDNETLRLYRSGGADPEGNQPGDLYVTIKVNSSYFFLYLYVGDDMLHWHFASFSWNWYYIFVAGSGGPCVPKRRPWPACECRS